MKNALSFIRWKFVLPVGIVFLAMVVFFIFFFDPMLTRALESAGGKMNGARVDIAGLKTFFLKGRLEIKNIQVAERREPMKNRVEMGPMAFQLDLRQVLTKRIVIPEAAVEGIRFGTDRKTSGLLPEKKREEKKQDEKPGLVSRLSDKYEKRFKLNLDGIKGTAKERVQFDKKDLKTYKRSQELEEKMEALPDQWKAKADNIEAEKRLKEIKKALKEVENTKVDSLEAFKTVPEALKKLDRAKTELKALEFDVKSLKTEAENEIRSLKAGIKSLDHMKKQDLADLKGRMSLDFADPERLVEGVVGESVMARLLTTLHYIELARKNLPSKKDKESVPEKPRARGMDIPFPRPASPPKFWLKQARLTGEIQDVMAEGSLEHLTSNPPRVGEPTILNLSGKKDGSFYLLKLILDHTGDVSKDGLLLQARNLKADKLVSGGAFGSSLEAGQVDAEFKLNAIGEEKIGGRLVATLRELKFSRDRLLKEFGLDGAGSDSPDSAMRIQFVKNLASALETSPAVQIEARIIGTWSDPGIKLTSNLASTMGRVMKDTIGSALKSQKQALEKQLNKILLDEKGGLNKKLSELTGNAGKNVTDFEADIKKEIEKAAGINLTPEGDSSFGLDKLFK